MLIVLQLLLCHLSLSLPLSPSLSLFSPLSLSLPPSLSHSGIIDGVTCYCDQTHTLPPARCMVLSDYTCTSSIGCYLRRWYSHEYSTILQRWDCIGEEHGLEDQLDYKEVFCGLWDTRNDAYRCCDSPDMCNKYLNITLQIEITSPVPSPTVTSYATVQGKGHTSHLHIGECGSRLYFTLLCLYSTLICVLSLCLTNSGICTSSCRVP